MNSKTEGKSTFQEEFEKGSRLCQLISMYIDSREIEMWNKYTTLGDEEKCKLCYNKKSKNIYTCTDCIKKLIKEI